MKIGLVLQTKPSLGGGSSFEGQLRLHLEEASKRLGHELIVFVPNQRGRGGEEISYPSSPLRMAIAHIRFNPILMKLLGLVGLGRTSLERRALRNSVDLLIFASPNHLAPGLQSIPFISTMWDFGHLDLPHATETSMEGLWAWRDSLYKKTLLRSCAVFCESEGTRRRLIRHYNVEPSRISKIGLLPFVEPDTLPKVLDLPHFIYPAIFWPHKNHLFLIRAFSRFIQTNGRVARLVLTGQGEMRAACEELAKELGLSDLIVFTGRLPRDLLLSLIKGSRGLLMPSLMGPSNLPPLEAALLGVPSVISNVHTMDDLLEGASAADPHSEEEWSIAMIELLHGRVNCPTVLDVAPNREISATLERVALDLAPWILARRVKS